MKNKNIKKKYIPPKVSLLAEEIAKVVCDFGGPDFFTCIGGTGSPVCSDPL